MQASAGGQGCSGHLVGEQLVQDLQQCVACVRDCQFGGQRVRLFHNLVIREATNARGLGTWLTGLPRFASGVNQQERFTRGNPRLVRAQVDTTCEKLSTSIKSLQHNGLCW